MKKFLPITAVTAGAIAFGLAAAAPAQALDCAPASIWTSHWHDGSMTGRIQQYSVDPTTGDLSVVHTVAVPHVYGDIAIENEDGDIWATDFAPDVPGDDALYRIDPATGAEVQRLELNPMSMADELNSLSFRADGRVYLAAGWSREIYIVDLADGTWTQPNPSEIPELDPTWDDHWAAGDFVTLANGEVLGVANAQEDATDPTSIWSYLVIFDFDAGTSRIVGRTSIDLFGAAQSGRWVYFPGYDGVVYRLDTIPMAEDPSYDFTADLIVAWDDPLDDNVFGIASPQDSGVCNVASGAKLPDTGGSIDIAMYALAGIALLAAGAAGLATRRARLRA